MRRRLLVAVPVAALVLGGCSGADPEATGPDDSGVAVDTPELRDLRAQTALEDCEPGTPGAGALPAVTLPCLGGGPSVDLSSLRGPMVINLWGSACGPCREEMPILQQFHATYGDQVAVLGIDLLDVLPGKALDQVRKRGVTYPQLADPDGEILATPAFAKARGLPYFAFVDAEGEVASLQTGGVTSLDQLVERVEDALDVRLA